MITAVSLGCGYPSSSIRTSVCSARFWLRRLLFTASSDAEGTLGGLVEVGRDIAQHIRRALELDVYAQMILCVHSTIQRANMKIVICTGQPAMVVF